MEKSYTVDEIKKISTSQRTVIDNECKLIDEFLKRVPRKINLKTELPEHDFKGQTIDDGFDIDFVCGEYKYQYVQIEDEFISTGYENDMIIKTTTAYVISSDEKIFFVQYILVFANPIISNEEIKIRAGHYLLVASQTKIHYTLNKEINHLFRGDINSGEIEKRISEYYLNQKIKFKIKPISQKFEHDDSDTIKMLKKEGILNNKLLFKQSANKNRKFSIVTEITRCSVDLNNSKIVAVKGRKKSIAGIYLGYQSEVVIVERLLYAKTGQTVEYLGKTQKVFPVCKFTGSIMFTNIDYNNTCLHTNIPEIVEFK
ncbi:MAG: hypothetical protein PHD15_04085 [Clostridia bacterium]|nr:hypothetical protein [Clostridia bacterium]MDD4386919.1 hypothetical protein [Clostridia bacterium]